MTSISADEQNVLRVIHTEHGNLASIIRGMQHFVRLIDQGGAAPDLKVFRAMLFYVDEYPDRVHHPKEDHHLFVRLKNRNHDSDDTIAELERQHAHGAKLMRRLSRQLTRYEFEGVAAFPAFRDMVLEYAGFYFGHMRLEEEVILPAAARYFTEEDWSAVNVAFSANVDPFSGVDLKDSFDRLFSMIVHITPAPMGVGDPIKPGWSA